MNDTDSMKVVAGNKSSIDCMGLKVFLNKMFVVEISLPS